MVREEERRSRLPIVAGLVALLVAVVAGCGGTNDGGGGTVSKTGDTDLIVAIPQTPPQLDPATASQFIESEVLVNTYDRLFEYKTENEGGIDRFVGEGVDPVDGMLAESWKLSPDKRTYTITLRKGVESAAGNPLTSEDVRWTLEREFALEQNGTYLTGSADIKGISGFKALDDRRFTITTQSPNVLFFKIMALPLLGIVDAVEAKKHATKDDPWASEWLKTNTAGFGAYAVTSNQPGKEVVLEQNPNYWGEKPPLEKIVMREVPSSANRVALVQRGDVDIAESVTARERQQVEASGGEVISFAPAQQASFLNMTNSQKPFDDKRVRQAVCSALPYDDIVKTVTLGSGRRQESPLPRPYEFYEPAFDYDIDVESSKRLLSEAGYPDGFETTLGFSTAAPEDEQTATLVQSALAKVGIKVNLLKQPLATFSEKWLGGGYPMSTLYVGAFVPDYSFALGLWFGHNGENFLNYMDYENADVDAMLDKARSTFDDADRERLAKDIQTQIAEDAPVCFLVEPGVHYATVSGLSGMNYFPDSALRFFRISKGAGAQ